MSKKPEKLSDIITEKGMQELLNGYTDLGTDYTITDEEQARILSSAMRKAGFEMKGTISVTQSRKKTVSIAVIAVAAACLCGFTAYAVYQYNYGNAFKAKPTDNGKAVTGDVQELESTTQPFNGVVLENTFKDIDFNVEGVVSDASRDHLLVTARKKDGTSFAESDEKRFEAGLQMCIPCNIDYFNGKEINDASELYWGSASVNCELNDDGSLSITMTNDWKIGDEEYDVILGFGDLFSYQYSEEKGDEHTDYLNSLAGLNGLSVYNGGETAKEYEQKLAAHKQLCHDLADDYYEGSFIIKAHISDNDFIITPEENDYGQKVVLSGMTCTISGDGESFLELAGAAPNNDGTGKADITLKFDNGEEYTETCLFTITEHSYMVEGGTVHDPECDSSTVWIYSNLSRFTDPNKVNEIMINGNTLWRR